MIKAGVKYCGNCNPSFNAVRLVQNIHFKEPEIVFCHWNAQDCDLIIVLHGCRCRCAELPDKNIKIIEVSDRTMDDWPIEPKKLESMLIAKIKNEMHKAI